MRPKLALLCLFGFGGAVADEKRRHRRRIARMSRRSCRNTASPAIGAARSDHLAWRLTSRRGSVRRTSRASSKTGSCRPGRPHLTSACRSRGTSRCPTGRSRRSWTGPREPPRGESRRLASSARVPRRLGPGHARPGRRHRGRFRRPGGGRGHLPLFRDPDRLAGTCMFPGSSIGRAIGGSCTIFWPMSTRPAKARKDAADSVPGYPCFAGPGRSTSTAIWAAGCPDRAHPAPRRLRPCPAEQGRYHRPGALPPQRQARDRPHAARVLLLPQAGEADPAPGAAPNPDLVLSPDDPTRRISRSRRPGRSPSTSSPSRPRLTCTRSDATC